ncbi:HAD family hydrolase [Desulfogranum mediterraneum]|uniref:HAD family hydrolase n=1 Tax=Desulfogranum mediterraneum TaxID=160661 RepID=UPI00048C9876|nr:HAD family hydrolase [Desulfogranum mediterraneum]
MLKLVVFDCDGVMINSREANRVYYNHLLSTFSCPPMDEAEVDYVHIHNVLESTQHIFRHHRERVDLAAVDRYREELDYAPFLRHAELEPDLHEFLAWLKPAYRTAISTARMNTMDLVMDIFELRPWFDMVVTASDVPNPKPAPDALEMILKRFRLQAEEVIYIGDSGVDRDHCAAVGIELIAFKNPELEARFHVDDFMSITTLPPFSAPSRG